MGPKRIALITDSTWCLPSAFAAELDIRVIPLHLRAGGHEFTDNEAEVERITEVLRTAPATTSQPTHAEIGAVLEECIDAGAERIVCVHLSSQLSGTCAAIEAVAGPISEARGVPIDVIDSRTVGGALGYAVAVAAASLAQGADAVAAVARARECAATSRVFLSVTDLKHLQRGGRLKAPQAAIGAALGIKPILHITNGEIRLLESVRGTRRAHQQLMKRSLAAAGAPSAGPREPRTRVSFAVHHVGAGDAADALGEQLRAAATDAGLVVDRIDVTPMSAVLAAHTGPGAMAVAVARTRGIIHN